MFLRIVIILQTVALFAAPVTAGLMLSTSYGHYWHSGASYTVFVIAVVHLVTAVLAWRPGGGSPKPIRFAAVFLAFTLAQVALGLAHVTVVHVPLGVLMFAFSLLHLSRVLAERRGAGDQVTATARG
ncbi:hypothetical protein [Nonomuraea sp. NPDC050310]|uniref:hypothetical protein n=1 Tax=unclassified Nonomuraea TaxID=2593643 RepID=UPI0033DC8D71